jgi:hypothetical protein
VGFAVAVLVAAAGAGVAQDQPGDPVSIYGDAEDELGNLAQPGTTIYALVDGEIEDTITVGADGQFGGPEPFAGHLAVNAGAGSEVVFAVDGPDGATAFETVDLEGADELVEVALTFPVASFEQVNVNGDGNLATDTTGDGRLNDINGDGAFEIFDVQVLFDNLDTQTVQDSAPAFNFAGLNDQRVSIFDIQGLFAELL